MSGIKTSVTCLLAILVLLPSVAHADGLDMLFGSGQRAGDLAVACFSRSYDKAHLAAHPDQNVTDMTALAYVPALMSGAQTTFNMTARFRSGGQGPQFSGICQPGASSLSCHLECDAGSFRVEARGRGSILVSLDEGVSTCDGEDPAFGSDDKAFRLDRVDMAACRDLIWDDEMRPRVLGAAGRGP